MSAAPHGARAVSGSGAIRPVFLLVASFPESVLPFRGALLQSLLSLGFDVHVAAPDLAAGEVRDELESRHLHVHDIALARTGRNPLADLRLVWQLFWLMRRVRPSVVLSYTIKPVIYGSIAAWLAGVPKRFAMITGLGYAFTGDRKGMLFSAIARLYRMALGKTHRVFLQNPDDEASLRGSGILPARIPSTLINGSGVDVSAFAVVPLPGTTSFLMIARLLGDKGTREYAQAARRVHALHPSVRFELAGWIDENPDSIRQAELDAWVAAGDAVFLGRLADVRPAIARCSVYVLPSYREGTPRTVLEAMAMGRAVITTDAPGCRETVVDGDNGYLVAVRSVEALEQAMLTFIRDPGSAARMGLRSRQIAEERYDVRKVNAVMLGAMGLP